LSVTEAGAPVPLDGQGYFNTPRTNYPAPPAVVNIRMIDLQ
jgi:hypothetical protein